MLFSPIFNDHLISLKGIHFESFAKGIAFLDFGNFGIEDTIEFFETLGIHFISLPFIDSFLSE